MMTKIGTPERLIRAAQAELIHSHGLLEMQAVAQRAKASVGLAYHHFGSKAGLIAAVVEAFYDRLEDAAFNPLVVGPLSRAAEVLDVEQAFTKRQLVAGAYNLRAGQRQGAIPPGFDPHLTISLMIGGIRQALIGALVKDPRPDRGVLTEKIWIFIAGALRLPVPAPRPA